MLVTLFIDIAMTNVSIINLLNSVLICNRLSGLDWVVETYVITN